MAYPKRGQRGFFRGGYKAMQQVVGAAPGGSLGPGFKTTPSPHYLLRGTRHHFSAKILVGIVLAHSKNYNPQKTCLPPSSPDATAALATALPRISSKISVFCAGYDVYATDVMEGDKLKSLKCKTAKLDVTSEDSIAAFKKSFGDQPLDVLLNIAGIMELREKDALDTTTFPLLEKMFAINTYGPLMLTQALLANILKSSEPRIGVMSSRVGSMTDNSSGGWSAYRASKAAVNSLFKNMAVDLKDKGVVVSMLHPGFAKTNLDASKMTHKLKDAVEPEEAAEKLWRLFLTKKIEDTGKSWHREGMELPW